jgi:hypothetical protein
MIIDTKNSETEEKAEIIQGFGWPKTPAASIWNVHPALRFQFGILEPHIPPHVAQWGG